MIVRCLLVGALCLIGVGCSSSDARMSALRADMASRQDAAEAAASRPAGTAEDKERARGYASAQRCMDQLQAHSRRVQATNMAISGGMAAVSLAGPGGILAARALGPVHGLALQNQGQYSVACY